MNLLTEIRISFAAVSSFHELAILTAPHGTALSSRQYSEGASCCGGQQTAHNNTASAFPEPVRLGSVSIHLLEKQSSAAKPGIVFSTKVTQAISHPEIAILF